MLKSRPAIGEVASEVPSKHLPPVTYEDMPEPLPLGKVLGPGVVSIGIGVSSGELIISTVYGRNIGEDLEFFRNEGQVLGRTVGPWFEQFFYITGALSLLAGAMGILDYVGRCVGDVLKSGYLADSEVFTESRIYAITVWLLVGVSIFNILVFSDQPIVLLVIQSSLSGIVMFVYSILLIWINRRALPEPIKIRGLRLGAMIWSVLAFGVLSVILVYTTIAGLFGG